ncbi:unnamed protein product [Nesidiocoris tenuis]|uniref:Uncharacterized protein n=1 Tax=Nesidiocoris tenuis TaxID=355587 RepID=A0A6H5GU92_9HEMI|nr:unnamed protein product [Nesidiocoris tenuis]
MLLLLIKVRGFSKLHQIEPPWPAAIRNKKEVVQFQKPHLRISLTSHTVGASRTPRVPAVQKWYSGVSCIFRGARGSASTSVQIRKNKGWEQALLHGQTDIFELDLVAENYREFSQMQMYLHEGNFPVILRNIVIVKGTEAVLKSLTGPATLLCTATRQFICTSVIYRSLDQLTFTGELIGDSEDVVRKYKKSWAQNLFDLSHVRHFLFYRGFGSGLDHSLNRDRFRWSPAVH